MKNLGRQEDVQSTKKAMEQAQSWFLSIPDKKTPWYLLNLDYADGYVHWYDVGQGSRSVVCSGGLEGKGFATDDCPICAYVLELYQESKRLKEEGDDAKAKQLKDRANRIHAKATVQFKAIRGQRLLMKTKAGKEWVVDWDQEVEDSTVEVGVISLSEAQFDGLTGMIKGEDTPFIAEGDDLGKRVLYTKKESRKGRTGGKYSAVVWDADEEESDMPELEVEAELIDMDLSENFEIDEEEVEKVYSLLSGEQIEEPGEDEEVATEDSDEEDTPENADLDDLPDDDDATEETNEELEFEDDIPGEEDEPEPPKKPASTKKTTTAASKKKTTTAAAGRKTTTTTSGKARSGKKTV